MEIVLKNTDNLHSGFFILNTLREELHPLKHYNNLFLTQEGNMLLKKEILKIIDEAKSVLKLCSFIITDKEIYNAIIEKAKNKQVAIFILTQLDEEKLRNDLSLIDFITEEEIKENPSMKHISYIRGLYENGIHVRASLSAHAKFIVADRKTGFITSANFTTPSLTFNTESGVYLDESSSKELDRLFDVMFIQGSTYKQFLGAKRKGKIEVVQSASIINKDLLPESNQSNLRYTCENYSSNLLNEIIKIINESDKYIYISTYSIVGLKELPQLVDAIKNAIDRNVSVSVFCRGMNYRNDHLLCVSELKKIGCHIYADVYNHSKGVINEEKGLIFTANIDGNHGLTNGFEVGYVLNESQRLEFLNFHKKLIKTAFYIFQDKPNRNDVFETYIAYEMIKDLKPPSLPRNLILEFTGSHKIDTDELKNNIIFYGRLKGDEYLIAGRLFFKCKINENIISIIESVKPRFDIEKYVVKFFEIKLIERK
jgi:phosphatidylserine/phosphatidylglycerophosphate/cardiolipin synthase-like enzyme